MTASEKAVKSNGGFNDIRHVILVDFRIEILHLLAGILLVLAKVEVGAGMDTFHLLTSIPSSSSPRRISAAVSTERKSCPPGAEGYQYAALGGSEKGRKH